MKRIKVIVLVLFVTTCCIALVFLGAFLDAGNYGYAQKYEFNVSKEVLIENVESLKNNIPEYKVPEVSGLTDSWDSDSNYYHMYIYYSERNKIVHLFISDIEGNSNKSTIYLDALNEGLSLGNWKEINHDFSRKENRKEKSYFRNVVLNKLKLSYKDKGNNMFTFWK